MGSGLTGNRIGYIVPIGRRKFFQNTGTRKNTSAALYSFDPVNTNEYYERDVFNEPVIRTQMKHILFATLLFNEVRCTDSTMVFICDSPNARRYHLKGDCRGLGDCSRRIIKTTLDSAKSANRTLCGWEKPQ